MDSLQKAILDSATTLVVSILVIALPLLTRELVRWIKSQVELLKGQLNEQQLAALRTVSVLAVQAAEQHGLAGAVTEKKKYALNFAENYLKELGYNVPISVISDAIESALWEEINQWAKERK